MTKVEIKQAENCRILAAFLRSDPRVRAERRFEMKAYVGTDWGGDPSLSCGTSACAAGWGSTIPSLRRQGLVIYKKGYATWDGGRDTSFNIDVETLMRVFGGRAVRGAECFSGLQPSDPDYIADLLDGVADEMESTARCLA